MNLKDELIKEYRAEAQRRSNERAKEKQATFDKWIDNELSKLKDRMKIVFGESFEYNITCRQNPNAETGNMWKPYVEIEELRAVFQHNGFSLAMHPSLTFDRLDLPDNWRKNPLNSDAPKASTVSCRAEVGEVLREWEKADWAIHDWPANGYKFEDSPPAVKYAKKRFKVCATHELNDLFHEGVKFTIHGTGLSDDYDEAWFVELHATEVGETVS